MKAVNDGNGVISFLDAFGGTGKTFLILFILDIIWAQSEIALIVASFGTAATFSEGRRTAHSAFILPLYLKTIDELTSNMTKISAMAKVLQNYNLV